MFKNLSAKIIQKIKKDCKKKKLVKDIKIFLKKKKKRQYGCEGYKNLSENNKQKLVKHRQNYYRIREKCFIITVRNYFNLEKFSSL